MTEWARVLYLLSGIGMAVLGLLTIGVLRLQANAAQRRVEEAEKELARIETELRKLEEERNDR